MPLTADHVTARHGSAACRRTDRKIQGPDPRLFTAFNLRTRRYEIWRRGADGAEYPIVVLQTDTGGFVDPDECNIQIELAGMDMARNGRTPEGVIRDMLEHNDRMIARRDAALVEEMVEIGKYVRPWIAQDESGGTPRFPAEDVLKGLKAAHGDN